MTMMVNSQRVERFTTVTAGDGSATLYYAYHTLGVLRHHLWCLSTPPQCGILTFTVLLTSKLKSIFQWFPHFLLGGVSKTKERTDSFY
jgi:hypothetical protein